MIMNEFDMFNALLEKAEKKEVDKEPAKEFFEGVSQLSSVLSFVKMKEEAGGLLFERGFDVVKVSVEVIGDDTVTLSYTKIDGFKEYKNKLTEAHEAAVSKFKLW